MNVSRIASAVFAFGVVCSCASASAPRRLAFPDDTGMIDVTRSPYDAMGDGVSDDTAAIQRALSAGLHQHAIVYLPAGTYRVSDTLKWHDPGNEWNGGWGRFLSVQGGGERVTTIRLTDRASGFTDPAKPKPVLMTASGDDRNNYNDANGEGNQAFENSIRDLTIDVGSGNGGAVGVDYQVSNWGAIRNVTIESSDREGAGHCGVTLERRDNGPGMLSRVTIRGFEYGIRSGQEICQLVFEHLTLRDQRKAGILQKDAIFSIRKLTSYNTVPAIRALGNAHLVLLDSHLSRGERGTYAVEFLDEAQGYLRAVSVNGYSGVAKNRGEPVDQKRLEHWSTATATGISGNDRPPNLTPKETPEYYDIDLSHWQKAGPPTGGDDADLIQAAMDAGRPVVYFPRGGYRIGKTIRVPARVRLIIGMGGTLGATEKDRFKEMPLFRIEGGTRSGTVIVDRLVVYIDDGLFVEHASPRALVLRDTCSASGYRATQGAGDVFIEDCCGGGPWRFAKRQRVWARQWNTEVQGNPKVRGEGSIIWCLGFKSEGGDTQFEITDGGTLEVLGGFAYTFGVPRERPAFICRDSDLLVSFAGSSYVNGFYHTIVQELRGGDSKSFTRDDTRHRGMGATVPLYVARSRR